jgi:OTU-like cysteine protease
VKYAYNLSHTSFAHRYIPRAIADQLNTMWLHAPESRGTDTAPGGLDYQHDFSSLRASAASYLRSHGEEFAPFLGLSPTDDEFLTYCNNVESVLNAEWGGQLEINALCLSLQRAVMVFSADAPLLVMGENFLKADRLPLKIAYHRHFYALGEHYNSVTPVVGPCSCCADKTNVP